MKYFHRIIREKRKKWIGYLLRNNAYNMGYTSNLQTIIDGKIVEMAERSKILRTSLIIKHVVENISKIKPKNINYTKWFVK